MQENKSGCIFLTSVFGHWGDAPGTTVPHFCYIFGKLP